MARRVQRPQPTIDTRAREYANLKHEEREAEAKRKAFGSELLPEMKQEGKTKIKVDFDEHTDATVAVKTREVNIVDQDKLKKAIGAKAFSKLTTPMLDDAKIEASIKLGDLDPNTVSQCMDTSESDYLEARFTKKRRP